LRRRFPPRKLTYPLTSDSSIRVDLLSTCNIYVLGQSS
jgi:hypothetical protein